MKSKFNSTIRTEFINFLTWKRAELIRYQSKQFVFIVQVDANRHKLLQVFFGKDGSLYVSFPYFDNNNGIVSIGTLSELFPKTTVKLERTGKVTTNKVKFSHHASGDVQFSQTGKVKTSMKKKSIPLSEVRGHIFTFHAQGLNHFESDLKGSDMTPSLSRTELSFRFEGKTPHAIKIVARWYDLKTFMSRSKGSSFGPIVATQAPDGKRSSMFLIGPPESSPLSDYVLGLTCEEIQIMDKEHDATMLFIGGFINPQDSGLYQKQSFLCASYPVLEYAVLEKKIGTIDLVS